MSLHLLRSEHKNKTCVKRCMMRKDRGRIGFACVVGRNPKTPNLGPVADDAITRGRIRGQGSPLYICGFLKQVEENILENCLSGSWPNLGPHPPSHEL